MSDGGRPAAAHEERLSGELCDGGTASTLPVTLLRSDARCGRRGATSLKPAWLDRTPSIVPHSAGKSDDTRTRSTRSKRLASSATGGHPTAHRGEGTRPLLNLHERLINRSRPSQTPITRPPKGYRPVCGRASRKHSGRGAAICVAAPLQGVRRGSIRHGVTRRGEPRRPSPSRGRAVGRQDPQPPACGAG